MILALLSGAIGVMSSSHPAKAAFGFGGQATDATGRYMFADLADHVLPSVVTVYVKESVQKELDSRKKQLNQLRRFFRQNPGFQEMLPFLSPDDLGGDGDQGDGDQGGGGSGPDLYGLGNQYVPTSSGSGIVVSADGYILTNHHVLTQGEEMAQKALQDESKQVTVVLPDGTEIGGKDVKVVYSNTLADLALLKINKTGLTPIKWGDSDKLRVGERVAAIGSPLDLRATVTQGIVCAKNRSIDNMSHLIQTDAVINPGSSGGALVNLDGELIGVNRLISSNTGRWQGFGFAIPSNDAKWFVDQVMKKGQIEYGYLGVYMTPDGADKMRMLATLGIDPNKQGVLVAELPPDSPGRKAGMQVGDFITEVDGVPVHDNGELLDRVKRQRVGATLKVTALRANSQMKPERLSFKITLTRRPDEKALNDAQTKRSKTPIAPKARVEPLLLGLKGEPTTTPDGVRGLKITTITPNSPADRAGLKDGDVIVEMNRHPIASIDDLHAAIKAQAPNRAHLLKFDREGREQLIPLEPDAPHKNGPASAQQGKDDNQDQDQDQGQNQDQ
jgi:serine protease Do